MNINKDIEKKIKLFPGELSDVARILLQELEAGRRSNASIEELIRDEIRELVLEEEVK
ncbi:hypothetical protein [Cytobacillus oceanisediminis]|uniref:hypothetical protein n=1 Tax=Cytobacillus oceanisediminis TaxID=665099 RepID=UPI001FB5486A|nr:hypothetical protein [Cytobacillus oceanisediminis]UOE53594.1 hypothetical protein IRB79_17175 [Cytobacillus oceanisediminis]